MIWRHTFFAALLLLSPLWPMVAVAQGLPGGATTLNETHGDWTVACVAPDGAARCAMSQTQIEGESRQRVLTVELRANPGNTANGVLILPFGLDLEDGIRLSIDEDAPVQSLRFSTCLPAGCVVQIGFDDGDVSALQAAQAINVHAKASENGQEVVFPISLNGFTSALARIADLAD